jgi:hypothetical protein
VATDLYIKVYPKNADFHVGENFTRLLEAVGAWSVFRGPWSRFSCGRGMLVQEEVSVEGPLMHEDVIGLMFRHGNGSRRWFPYQSESGYPVHGRRPVSARITCSCSYPLWRA